MGGGGCGGGVSVLTHVGQRSAEIGLMNRRDGERGRNGRILVFQYPPRHYHFQWNWDGGTVGGRRDGEMEGDTRG